MSAVLTDQLTPEDFAAKVKAKYPDYADVPDDELVGRVVEKYPEYRNTVQGFDIPSVISRVATEKGVDPNLMLAIGAQESGYNPKAVSPKNARGVLQVVPGTAARFADPDHDPNTVEGNIRAGTNYVKFLHDRYKGNTDHVIAGYFTGEGNVDKALARGQNLPTTVDTSIGLSTPNYVQQVKGRYNKLTAQNPQQQDDRLSVADFAAKIKAKYPDYADVPDEELVTRIIAKYPEYKDSVAYQSAQTAPVVNVGAPGRNVGPAMTPDQLAAAEPWRKPAGVPSYQQVTPEAAAKGIARGVQDKGLRTEYENLALNADVQKALQLHAGRLAELEAKRNSINSNIHDPRGFKGATQLTPAEQRELESLRTEKVNTQAAYQKQLDEQRPKDIESVAQSFGGDPSINALMAFVKKHGPLTEDEQKRLHVPTNYLSTLSMNAFAGLAQDAAIPVGALARATGSELLAGKAADVREVGNFASAAGGSRAFYGIPGAAVQSGTALLPHIGLSAIVPEAEIPYWFSAGALESYSMGGTPTEIVEHGLSNLTPIAGAKIIGHLAVGGPLAQFAQRVFGNGFVGGVAAAAQHGNRGAIATGSLMGMVMGLHGPEGEGLSEDAMRKIVTDPELQSAVTDAAKNPKLFIQVYPKVEAKLRAAGLTDEQASQFVDNLKSASEATDKGSLPVAQQTTTTPEDLAKENQNAEEIRSDQGQANQQGTTVTAGQNVGRENIQQRAEAGTIASDTQNQIAPVNEFEAPPKVSTGPIQNKSILEAVRALGRIKIQEGDHEFGELSQFGNKEAKGQGLIGPNGRLTPDLMRERLEEAGFRDPNSLEEPGAPGSLSLDGMYELMDREQRGDKVYSAHRDSNLVDADLAKEYEQHRESGNADAQFGHEAGLEDEWRNPDSPLRQAYERIISGDDANGDEFVSVAKQYGISPESIEEHIQRATRTRESLPPVEVTPGGNDGRSEVAPEEGRVTGIKNAVTDAERAERGLSPIEKDIYDEFPKVFDDVKRGIDSGKIDIRGLTREWAEHPKGLSENEEAALIYDRARLYNNKEEIIDEITSAIASGDKAAEVEARVRLAPIEDAIVANEKAAVRSGTIWGRSGAMRQQMMKADYSLANIERRFRAKTGDSPTAEQSAKFKKLSEDLEDAQRAVAKRDDIISDLEAQRWAKTEARKEAASGRRVKRAGSLDAIKKEWDGQKDALVRLLKLQGIGEPAAGGKKGLGGPEAGAVDPNLVTLPADVAKLLIEMARNRIRAGVTDANEIVDSIHEFVKDKFDVSVRQISDAISGYGKQSKLSTDEVEVQLREVKRIRRLMSALEDAQKGEAPQRSGLKRDKPTRLVRELTRQVNEALRKNGYKLESADRSPEEQYQSALDGVKTRLRNQIQDLNERIATGRKPEGRTPIALDEEAKALKAERDGLAATLQEIDGPRKMTDEQRVAATEKALEKSIADNEARIADKRLMPDGKPEAADSPRIQELRKRNEEVKKALEDLRKADPAVLAAREVSALKTYHKQLATRETEMTKTLADIKAGTYEPRAKRTQRNDPVSVEARARAGRIQDEIEKELLKAQLAKRNWTDKALDFAVKWRRNMLLSNPLTLAKLATAAASRVVISPVEEAVGGIISHLPIASKIAAKAPREGGFSVAAEAKAIYGYTRQLMQFAEAREIVRTGKTRLDTIYGAKGDLPPEAIEFFGRLHKLMKAPAQAAEFARSYQKRVEWALNNKMDPTDPVTQAALASSAYLDAQRAILMQDNAAVSYYRGAISRMRALDSTGKAAHPGYARALEMLLPIVKVPTNFVTETANYAAGGLNALAKLRRANWDTSKLTADEADSIMRSLKKQFVGAGLFALGYGFADKVGGYYQQGEKRKEGAPGAGEVQLFGHNIPHWLLHSSAMEVIQLGATFRHVMDAHADYSTLGKLGSGALAGVAGLSQQVPFIETPATIADAAKSDRKFGKFAANTVGGMVIPPVAKKIAEFQDSGVKRKPGNIGEDLKMMIPSPLPGNRKTVPTEEDRKEEQKQKRQDKRASPDVDKIYENRMKRKGLSP